MIGSAVSAVVKISAAKASMGAGPPVKGMYMVAIRPGERKYILMAATTVAAITHDLFPARAASAARISAK